MGLIVPQTVRVRTNPSNYKYYKEKGYRFKKCGDFIEVNVLDLSKSSRAMVKVICDICGKESEMWYGTVVEYNKENKLITCGSDFCKHKKSEDTCTKKYGVKSVFQAKEVKEKIKQTNLERHGCEYPMQNKEIQNKSKDTCTKKYGVDNPNKAQEIKDKKKNTCQLHFGADSPFESKEIRDKIKDINLGRYGAESPFGSKEIQDKIKDTWQKKYGENIINPFQVESVREKSKQTWQENHGKYITSPFQLESVREKSKQTWLKNYSVNNPMQCKEIQDKAKATCQEKYGGNAPTCSEEIQNKVKATNLERHGVEYPTQNEEIKNKVLDSYQFNRTGPSSRGQRYINYILNGTLNKHICDSLVDIYMEKENIIIEYDGSGHFLGDKMNGNIYPTKESLLYEKEREDKIINNGYRMIRFIATKDRIPSDEVILNLIEGFKNSDFKVIRINFEEGTIDRDYDEKWYCNFGKLRKITKEDLEKFKKQEENTSEN